MIIDNKKLIQALQKKQIKSAVIKSLKEESKATGADLLLLIRKQHILHDEELGKVIADIIGFSYVNLSKTEIPSQILEIVPENIALKQGVITFELDEANNVIKVATIDPFDVDMIADIEKKTGYKAQVYYTTENNIKNIIGRYNRELKNIFLGFLPRHLRYESDLENKIDVNHIEEEIPIVKIFDSIMLHAFRHHASDIHIESSKRHTTVRYRVDGILHKIVELPKIIHEPLVTRCKILSGLRIDETRAAQDGRIATSLDGESVAFRVSILPTHFGEKVVMRLLVDIEDSISLIESGLSEEHYKTVIRNSVKPFGMMIVTGPTGSGKTTTLYNIIKLLNSDEINIATIEDPIEYGIEGINQVQVNHATDLTFANGLRALLRQDPDSILVGEIRDTETAKIAVESAMTGHMVFSTLHANSASIGIPRLTEMGIEPFLLTAAINCILAQRLVRRICPHCVESKTYSAKTLDLITDDMVDTIKKILNRDYSDKELRSLGIKDDFVFYAGKGCKACGNTGYKGRIGLYEVMEVEEDIKKVILEGGSSDAIQMAATNNGMSTILEDGIEKALSGLTSLEEVIRVIKN